MASRAWLGTLVAAALAAAGCLSKPATVPQSFSLDPPSPRESSSQRGVILAVSRVEVAPPYSGQPLVYQTGEHELERDPYARFIAPPGWLLTVAIQGYLANADFVREVAVSGRGPRPDAVVEVAVSQLVGELRPDGSTAILALRIRVVRGGSGSTIPEILLKTYSKAVPIPRATAGEVVSGWNRGLAEIMTEFQDDLRSALRSGA